MKAIPGGLGPLGLKVGQASRSIALQGFLVVTGVLGLTLFIKTER